MRERTHRVPADARHHVDLLEAGQLHEELQHTANNHRPGERVDGRLHMGRDEHGRDDECHVQQYRREGGK
jgi:hypothetical protein